MKKMLLTIGTLATVIAPIVSVVSCGTNKKSHTNEEGSGSDKSGEAKDSSFEKTKTEYTDEVNSLNLLTTDQKNDFKSRIKSAKSQNDLDVVKNSYTDTVKKIIIDEFNDHSDIDLSTFRKDIGGSLDLSGILSLKDGAQNIIKAQSIKDATLYIENTLVKLSPGKKGEWFGKINGADTLADIDALLLQAAKENATAIINGLEEISDQQEIDLSQKIKDSSSLLILDGVLSEAYKDNGVNIIDKLNGLFTLEKDAWKAQMDGIKSEEEMNDVFMELKSRMLSRDKNEYLEILKKYKDDLSLKEFSKTSGLIVSASSLDEIKDITNKIISSKAKENAAKNAIEEISSYYSSNDAGGQSILTLQEKDNYINTIESATSVSDINKAMYEMRKAIIDNAREYAWYKIYKIFPNNNELSTKYSTKIDDMPMGSVKEIDSILGAALLEKSKVKAKENLENLNLEDDEVLEFELKIDNAKSEIEINEITQNALVRIERKKAETYINTQNNLSQEQKLIWITQLGLDLDIEQINKTINLVKSIKPVPVSSIKTMPANN